MEELTDGSHVCAVGTIVIDTLQPGNDLLEIDRTEIHAINNIDDKISRPKCSTIQMVWPCPMDKRYKIKRIVVLLIIRNRTGKEQFKHDEQRKVWKTKSLRIQSI